MVTLPKWATPERRAYLVELFERSRGLCVYGHFGCKNPRDYYADWVEDLVEQWVRDDREYRAGRWQAEQERIHRADPATKPPYGQRFDPVARHEFLAHKQPTFYMVGVGPNALTHHRTAIIKVPSTPIRLHVDVDDVRLSKNARRKNIRYGKGFAPEVKAGIDRLCFEAVKDYWA